MDPSSTPAPPAQPLQLAVTAIPGLDTDRILALSVDAELKPFIGANWVDYLPELARDFRMVVTTGDGTASARAYPADCDILPHMEGVFGDHDFRRCPGRTGG